MAFANNIKEFGTLTKILHWTIFGLFVVQYFLVYRREYFPKGSPEKLNYLLLHKSLGACVLGLAFVMILWRHVGVRPLMMSKTPVETLFVKITHFLLYVGMLAFPLTGISMSMLGGREVSVFGLILPQFLPKNEAVGKIMYTSHVWISYIIIGLVSLHVVGALFHHLVRKDDVLKRMSY
jgi:superoxide oxidase